MDVVLAQRGYVDGRTAVITRRFANGDFSRLPALAAELVDLRVDIIVAQTTAAAQAAKAVTSDIPIVVTSSGDAVGSGLVASLARPGGNVTGVSFLGTELAIKQIELIRELLPRASRIGFVANRRMAPEPIFFEAMTGPAQERGLSVTFIDVRRPSDFPAAFEELERMKADAAIVALGGFFSDHRAELLAVAARYPIPAIYFRREFVPYGGFASYGTTLAELHQLAADQVDRILKGANPAEMPIRQPMRFEFVINLRTARRLGIEVPTSLLDRADDVIE
jgi:putative ABC transport system substrate-binding protein